MGKGGLGDWEERSLKSYLARTKRRRSGSEVLVLGLVSVKSYVE